MEIVTETLKPEKNSVTTTPEPAAEIDQSDQASAVEEGGVAPVLTHQKKPEVPSSTSHSNASLFSNKFAVQVGSYHSQDKADTGFARLKKQFPSDFKGLSSYVRQVCIDNKGVFYRLYVGPFNERKNSEALCKSLMAKEHGCIITKLR